MNKKILFIIRYKFFLNYFNDLIEKLITEEVNITFISTEIDTYKELKTIYPKNSVYNISSKEILDVIIPHLIICTTDIWFFEFKSMLLAARKNNIPVFAYDHGTHYCKSYYLLEKDEYTNNYRSNISMCSHVICWGNLGKDNWESFGLLKEKMHITGGLQYDSLYVSKNNNKDSIYRKLKIPKHKKILLLFTALGHMDIDKESRIRTLDILKKLKNINNEEYQLVIKPHPIELLSEKKDYYPENAKIIANINDKHKFKCIEIDINDVIRNSYAVIGHHSSVLTIPLILNIPILYIDVDIPKSNDFYDVGKDAFILLKKGTNITSLLEKLNHIYDDKKKIAAAKMASLMNLKNDGKSVHRFIELIKKTFNHQENGKKFYPLTIEKEFLKCVKLYPDLPYPYQNLVKFYIESKNIIKAEYWLKQYMKYFKNPFNLIENIERLFFLKKEYSKVIMYLNLLSKYKFLLPKYALHLGISYRMMKKFRSSITLFKKYITLKMDDNLKKEFFYEYSLSLISAKLYKQSVSFLLKALKIKINEDSLNYRIYYRLGESSYMLKQFDSAEYYFNTCLKLNKNHLNAKEFLIKIKNFN